MSATDADQLPFVPLRDPSRRAFLRGLGGGLLVACLAPRAGTGHEQSGPALDAGEPWPDRGARPPRQVAAWLHVAPDGAVTAYTGKVEFGQGSRATLTQAVAEELRVPFASVRLVMGDTAQVMRDVGTFGSLTTPTMFLQLRRAAAAARLALIDLGSKALGVPPGELTPADGHVRHEASGRSLAYGDLTRGEELTADVPDDVALIAPAEWTVAGTSIPRPGAEAFVTGRHVYGYDFARPGMAHGKVLRPPTFGASLRELDAAGAEAMEGAVVVREEGFAGVVAPDLATARRALDALRPTWSEPYEPDCDDATLSAHLEAKAKPGPDPSRQEVGSLAEGRAGAAATVTATYTAAFIAHAPLEPRSAVAEWDGDRLTVWSGTQVPFGIRGGVARHFGLPEEQVRVIVPDIGAGFGGKHTPEVEIEAARMARAAGRPVKVAWTREEEFTWGYFRPAAVVRASASAASDGRLTAWEFVSINPGTTGIAPPYVVPNRVVEHRPSEPPLRQGAYRALASTVHHFARESLVDELARAVGLDPLEFRLRNLDDNRLKDALRAAADRFGWGTAAKGEGRGFGIAGGAEKDSRIVTCAEVEVDRKAGTVKVVRLVAAFEPGAIVHPDHMRNQVEGALVQGLGGALFEAVRFAGGRLRNASFGRYRVPRFSDLPSIDVVLIDRRDLPPAGGGEMPIVAVAPAIANAIHDAVGVRLRDMPLVPRRLSV